MQLQENTPEEELSAETSPESNSADIEQESLPAIPLMLPSPEAVPEYSDVSQDTETVTSEQPEPEEPAPKKTADDKTKPELEKPKRKSARKTTDKAADKPVSTRQAFYQLDFRELDRKLPPEQE